MSFLPMVSGTTAAAVSFLATPLVIRWALARKLFALPGGRSIHDRPVPRLGGVAILAGASAGLLVALVLAPDVLVPGGIAAPAAAGLVGLLAGGVIAFATGLVDDLRGLRPFPKLLAQTAAALVVYLLGFRIDGLSWGDATLSLAWLSLPVTLLWIVGVTNAYNLVDGIDGLATGMGIVAFGATLAAALALGNPGVVVVAAILLGALIGFLPHNFNPARIFLGDSGSLFVGFVLAVLSVQGAMKSATAVLVAVPLFALAIPLLDTAATMLRRWLRGLPISEGDARHIHHRLLARGFSHRDAVLVLYLVAAGFAVLGILVGFAPPGRLALIAALGGALSALVLALGMRGLAYDEFTLAGKVLASGPRRLRRVIRDRIIAGDLVNVLSAARSIEEINAVLADAAADFGFAHMEVVPESEPRRPLPERRRLPQRPHVPERRRRSQPQAAWSLDFPLLDHGEPLVLRIQARVGDEFRPYGAERIANVLGPALRTSLHHVGLRTLRPVLVQDPDPRAAPERARPSVAQ